MAKGAKPAPAYTPDVREVICERLAAGESLKSICRSDGMPGTTTVLRWVDTDKVFEDQYTRARTLGYRHLADEIVQIADDGANDTYTTEDGRVMTDYDVVARSKLRIDTRKWMLSKMLPKVYGDKLELSGDPANPIGVSLIEGVALKGAVRGTK